MDETLKQQWEAMSSQAMEELLRWRTAHPAATFAEIERELDERMADVRARMLGELAALTELGHPSLTPCPECGRALQAAGSHQRKLKTQRHRDVAIERDYARCPKCGVGFFPPRPSLGAR
jgi:hypothetical protein